MDELKVRLAKLSKQFEDMQTAQQSMAAQQSQAQQQAQQMAQAPAPDVLYNNALRDYNGGKNDLATQEFNDYIKFYPEHRSWPEIPISIWRKFSSRLATIKNAVTKL